MIRERARFYHGDMRHLGAIHHHGIVSRPAHLDSLSSSANVYTRPVGSEITTGGLATSQICVAAHCTGKTTFQALWLVLFLHAPYASRCAALVKVGSLFG